MFIWYESPFIIIMNIPQDTWRVGSSCMSAVRGITTCRYFPGPVHPQCCCDATPFVSSKSKHYEVKPEPEATDVRSYWKRLVLNNLHVQYYSMFYLLWYYYCCGCCCYDYHSSCNNNITTITTTTTTTSISTTTNEDLFCSCCWTGRCSSRNRWPMSTSRVFRHSLSLGPRRLAPRHCRGMDYWLFGRVIMNSADYWCCIWLIAVHHVAACSNLCCIGHE